MKNLNLKLKFPIFSVFTLAAAQHRDLPYDWLAGADYDLPGVKAVDLDSDLQAQQQQLPPPDFRNSNPMLFAKFADINNYGCFCHLGINFHMTKGEPLDEYDKECRDLVKGYECIIMDAQQEFPNEIISPCVPYEVRYLEPLNLKARTSDTDIIRICESENNFGDNANCKINSCIVESFFVRNLAVLKERNVAADPDLLISNGFDFDQHCKLPTENYHGEKACCGQYPKRRSFKVRDGAYDCCNESGKVYQPDMMTCCDDGSISLTCP